MPVLFMNTDTGDFFEQVGQIFPHRVMIKGSALPGRRWLDENLSQDASPDVSGERVWLINNSGLWTYCYIEGDACFYFRTDVDAVAFKLRFG